MAEKSNQPIPGNELRVTVTAVTEAVIDVMKSANSGGIVDRSLAFNIAGAIRPALEKALIGKVGSGAELIGLSAFRNILNQHLGSPASAYIDAELRKAMQHTLENANRSGSEFSVLLGQLGSKDTLLARLSAATQRDVARSEGRRSSADFTHAFNGGVYSAANLSAEMRSYVDPAHGITGAHVAGVGNYLSGLGINAQQYTGYFVGSSEAIRNAIEDHVKNGTKLTDEQIKNSGDVKAVIGAVKAGKVKKEDAPESVQRVMEDMKSNGLDPANSDVKAIQQYLKDNPHALEAAKRQGQRDNSAAASGGPGAAESKPGGVAKPSAKPAAPRPST
jgi:hypothetical protein